MKVVIDASPLLFRSAGVKNYLYHLSSYLKKHAGSDTVDVFPYIREPGPLTHERSVLPPWDTWKRLALLGFLNLAGSWALERTLPGADIFHASNQVRRPPRNVLLTATIHDLTAWLMPELHTPANVRADHGYAARILARADGLIAVSENTRQDAIRHLGLAPERITVIYPGVPDAYFRATDADARRAAQEFGLERPYVLFVGSIEPRKNVGALLDAFQAMPEEARQACELVVAGPPGWSAQATLDRLRAGMAGVRYLGYVPEDLLPGLTAGAMALAYPSIYEGFGFPLAQAMACGVPVLTSNVSSMPEVAGDGGLLVDPRDPRDIRSALERLVLDPVLRVTLGVKAASRAEEYQWDRSALRSLEFFRRVADAVGRHLIS